MVGRGRPHSYRGRFPTSKMVVDERALRPGATCYFRFGFRGRRIERGAFLDEYGIPKRDVFDTWRFSNGSRASTGFRDSQRRHGIWRPFACSRREVFLSAFRGCVSFGSARANSQAILSCVVVRQGSCGNQTGGDPARHEMVFLGSSPLHVSTAVCLDSSMVVCFRSREAVFGKS
jgi:hypothetical protein